jgi:hypothetical protein
VSFGTDASNIAFDVNDTTVRTVNIQMPYFNGGGNPGLSDVSWSSLQYTDTFQNIFLTLITAFNVFCDKSVQTNIVDDVTTPPTIPPPTIVKDTIANFKSVIDSAAFAYSF